jgi:UbiD family decarboxylase
VTAGPVTGLPIPADAEIAVEGFINPGEEKMEGPFGEFTGYFAGERAMRPYLRAPLFDR